MSTLNGGFVHPKDSNKHITEDERNLISEFIRTKGVYKCPPIGATGNEMSPSTHDRIMDKRKEYRAKQREIAKAKKEGKSV